MENILQTINNHLKDAIRSRNTSEVAVLRMLIASLKNKEIELRKNGEAELSDEIVIKVVQSEIKKRRDSILAYEQGGREDLAAKEKEEINIIEKYLPEQISDEEIEKIVTEVIKGINDASSRDFGKIMGQVMPKVQGRSDGNKVGGIVKRMLN